VIVVFNGKSFESTLPYMTVGTIVLVVTSHVSCQKPMHPSPEVSI
jgi:hypothetical protein